MLLVVGGTLLVWGTAGRSVGGHPPPRLLFMGGVALVLSVVATLRSRVDRRSAASAASPTPLVSGTILVVDDEPIIRDLARIALEQGGFRVLEARDGLEAVELFRTGREAVDLVLLDMIMPRMGGAEAFRLIRHLAPGVPILLTSGYTQVESLEGLADLPPDGFLQKPFRVRQLVTRAREVLGGQAGRYTTK
nr:response regulator [Geothrix sp. SG10]